MRIRTQFLVTMLLFGIVLAAISASAVITTGQVAVASDQEEIANNIALGAGELSYLSNDFLVYHEDQQLARWKARFDSFSADVARLRADTPEQQVLVRSIQAGQSRLKDVFGSVASSMTGQSPEQGAEPAFLQVSWSRMAVQSQGLVSDASRLAHLLRDQVDNLRRTNTIVVFALVAVLFAYFFVNYLTVQRRTLRSIAALQAGTAIIGSGDLSFRVEEKKKDEVGDLARAFNTMATNLKEVTASKTDLEREVAERQRAQAELAHLASFPRLNPNPIVELDADGNVSYMNPAALEAFPDLQAAGSRHQLLADWKLVAGSLSDRNAPVMVREVAVGDRWYEQTISHVPAARNFRIYARDMTARKKAEEALKDSEGSLRIRASELEAANKELESFSYSVSHDLRAPLRIMDGYSRALLEDYAARLDDQGKEWLNSIRKSSQLMGQLIDDLLGLSRVVRMELRMRRVDLSGMALSVTKALTANAPDRKVEFKIAPSLEAWGDENLLHLVVENLLGNAFKFTSTRPVAHIEFGSTRGDGGAAYYVKDDGVGFDMKYAGKLFTPFQRLHSSKEFPGTGIGLVTVERIVKRHGGKVWAEAEPDKGATFYFTLG